MKYLILIIALFYTQISNAIYVTMTESETHVERSEPKQSKPEYTVKKLAPVKLPDEIILKEKPQRRKPIQITQEIVVEKVQPKKEEKIARNECEKDENGKCKIEYALEGANDNFLPFQGFFCQVYDRKTHNVVQMYQLQIKKMDAISAKNLAPQKYLCRAFSNVMLINEGTKRTDAEYIKTAKNDIKKAIEANKNATGRYKIDTIDDLLLTNMLNKYNEIILKGMPKEEQDEIMDNLKADNLRALQKQINEYYGEIDGAAYTVGDLKSKEDADLTPYYKSNPLKLLNSVQDTNGDVAEQTKALRSFRATETEKDQTEVKLEEMLDTMTMLEKVDS